SCRGGPRCRRGRSVARPAADRRQRVTRADATRRGRCATTGRTISHPTAAPWVRRSAPTGILPRSASATHAFPGSLAVALPPAIRVSLDILAIGLKLTVIADDAIVKGLLP